MKGELEEECEKYRVQAERATQALNENLESNEECTTALKEYKYVAIVRYFKELDWF